MASGAAAHISLDQGGTHLSRYGDSEIKLEPCGRTGGTRSTNVYTYRPGETITLSLVEFIGHPGYFRIAFDADGDDAFVDPQYVDPINRECMPDPIDHCGQTDFFNNESVLMDNLEPHSPTNILEPVTYSFDVTLPNVTCDNCTLQVIQVMTDVPGIHAPYDPEGANADDIYYQCIDLVLEGEPIGGTGGGDAGGAVTPDAGTAPLPGLMPVEGESSSEEGCGCSLARASTLTPTSSGALAVALALVLRRRRRQRP
jgi:MYXO-CTERM domain-containing protein